MKIAFLTPEFPHAKTGSSGGLGTSIRTLGISLTKIGHSVTVYVYEQLADDLFFDNGMRIVSIQNVKLKGLSWWFTRQKIAAQINQDVKKNLVDILEVPDWTGISAWMKIKVPVIMRLHGSDSFFCHLENRPVKRRNRLMEARAFKKAQGIIAVSKFVGETSNLIFNSNRIFETIPNGIDTAICSQEKKEDTNHTILYFGTLIRKKGALELPFIFNRVIEQFPDAQLVLVGADGSDISSKTSSTWALMKPHFSHHALKNVSYLGKIPHEQIQSIVQQASICIFPSFAEACPVSWLEAMAMGKAIVASDIGWAPELIHHRQDGLLCNPKEHVQFADYILTLLTNRSLASQLGNHAKQRCITYFDSILIAKKNLAFYQHIMNESK